MREICLSGSMSGNRNQNQAKPDCGGEAKAQPIATGRLKPLRLFSTLLAISLKTKQGSTVGGYRGVLWPFKIRRMATIVFQLRVVAGAPYSLSIWPR